jgi:hypothetical protein
MKRSAIRMFHNCLSRQTKEDHKAPTESKKQPTHQPAMQPANQSNSYPNSHPTNQPESQQTKITILFANYRLCYF